MTAIQPSAVEQARARVVDAAVELRESEEPYSAPRYLKASQEFRAAVDALKKAEAR